MPSGGHPYREGRKKQPKSPAASVQEQQLLMHSRTRPLRSVNANCSAEEARRRPDVWGSWMVLELDREELLSRSPAAVVYEPTHRDIVYGKRLGT